jgi:hypothetical protein
VKRRWLVLTTLALASACNQAPDDDPGSINSTRAGGPEDIRRRPSSRAETAPVLRAVKYELQGSLAGAHSFASRERCEKARREITEGQAKADKKLSDHGMLLPSRPMLACVPI